MGFYELPSNVQNFTIKEVLEDKVVLDMTNSQKEWFGYDSIDLKEFKEKPIIGQVVTCQRV